MLLPQNILPSDWWLFTTCCLLVFLLLSLFLRSREVCRNMWSSSLCRGIHNGRRCFLFASRLFAPYQGSSGNHGVCCITRCAAGFRFHVSRVSSVFCMYSRRQKLSSLISPRSPLCEFLVCDDSSEGRFFCAWHKNMHPAWLVILCGIIWLISGYSMGITSSIQ